MYTVELVPIENTYNSREVAAEAQNWLLGSVGILEESADKAIQKAENALEGTSENEFKGEVGEYYTISAVEVEDDE